MALTPEQQIALLEKLAPKGIADALFIKNLITRLKKGEAKPAKNAKADTEGVLTIPEVQRVAYEAARICDEDEASAKAIAKALMPKSLEIEKL